MYLRYIQGLQVCIQEKLRMLVQLHLCTWIILDIFEQRVGFEQQISIKAKLVEYTCLK